MNNMTIEDVICNISETLLALRREIARMAKIIEQLKKENEELKSKASATL